MRKKKLLFHSNHHSAFSGFGKNCKNVLRYLYLTDKYDIVELANGKVKGDPSLENSPWKCIGSLPSDPIVAKNWQADPQRNRAMAYGAATIDEIIKEEKPDIYIGAEDIWAFSGYWDKAWWSNITCAVWTTIDSLPLLPEAVNAAPKIKNYFVWSPFAEKAFKKIGHEHVDTIRGIVEHSNFFKLKADDKKLLRKKHNLSSEFIIGFVFRNQLRKSVPNLLDGFKLFKSRNPYIKPKLLFHTSWKEGWDILRLAREKGIDLKDILTTYVCSNCKTYKIIPFSGHDIFCDSCFSKKSLNTVGVEQGVTEKQLNEIYNLMDVYCHPFTSGGQEIPVQEAKLCELTTLVTNYSCGEDLCTLESGGLPLDWSEYREPGTQFIKATTSAQSISLQLETFLNLPPSKKEEFGSKSRDWVIKNFSPESVGSKIEKLLDESPFCDWDFDFSKQLRNPDYSPPNESDDGKWIIDIYKNILMTDVGINDEGYKHWMQAMEQGRTRSEILKYFRDVAIKENLEIKNNDSKGIEEFTKGDEGKKILYVMPRSIGDVFWSTSLLPSLSKLYPEYNIYFATDPKLFQILDNNPYIHKVIPYSPEMDNLLLMEGQGDKKGFFDIAFLPHIGTQKMFNYQHNGEDKIELDIRDEKIFANIDR